MEIPSSFPTSADRARAGVKEVNYKIAVLTARVDHLEQLVLTLATAVLNCVQKVEGS